MACARQDLWVDSPPAEVPAEHECPIDGQLVEAELQPHVDVRQILGPGHQYLNVVLHDWFAYYFILNMKFVYYLSIHEK